MAHDNAQDAAARDLSEMFAILAGDMKETAAALTVDPSQYHRRVAVRGLFALVEAVTYLLKQHILDLIAKGNKRYTFEEIALLKDEAYTLDERAQPVVQPKFLPTDTNFRFAINLCARDYQPEYELDVADNGWNQFRQALRIRHRITHPKAPKLLEISDDEMQAVKGAYAWFLRSYVDLMVRGAEDLTRRVSRLNDEMNNRS
jgi:hypothetical protein